MYMLECSDGTYYVGSTVDLRLRFEQHQAGAGARYTSVRLPVRLVYHEEFDEVRAAFAREKQVQKWSRAKRQALIDGRQKSLPELSEKRRPDPVVE